MAANTRVTASKKTKPIKKVSKKATKTKPVAEPSIKPVAKDAKLTNASKKEYAFDLFINTDYSQKRIAELVGISEKTLTLWKTIGNWEELKQAGEMTAQKIIRNIYAKMSTLTEAGDKLNADELLKAAKVIESLNNQKTTISQVINVFKDFITFLFKIDPDLAKQVNLFQQKYVTKLVQE